MSWTVRRRRKMVRRIRDFAVIGAVLIVGVTIVGAFVDGRLALPRATEGPASSTGTTPPAATGSPASPAPSLSGEVRASDLPGLLRIAAETTSPRYDRDLFEHWIDADGDRCNTRYEVLIEESTTPVTISSGCWIDGGTWVSALDGGWANSPSQIEIDHHIPLAEAWRSGASAWNDAQRRDFANDLGAVYMLNASSSVANQSKGDKDPGEWLPTNTAHTCEYVATWALAKYRWSLAVDSVEFAAIERELSGACGDTVVTLPDVRA